MLYELPISNKVNLPKWEKGIGFIPAKHENIDVNIPILKGVNYITFGVTGTGKTRSFILPAAKKLLSEDPSMLGVFLKPKGHFWMLFILMGIK